MQKGFSTILVLISLLIVTGLGVGGYFVVKSKPIQPSPSQQPTISPVGCTLEAKQCPDGSYVSRQGPQCEFAPCPSTTGLPMITQDNEYLTPEEASKILPLNNAYANWKTYSSDFVTFRYPPDWRAGYGEFGNHTISVELSTKPQVELLKTLPGYEAVIDQKDVTINGHQAVKQVITRDDFIQETKILISTDNAKTIAIMIFSSTYNAETQTYAKQEDKDTTEKILTSIRVLN